MWWLDSSVRAVLPVQNIINVAIHVTTQARSPFSNNVLSSFKQERKKGDEQAETTKSENHQIRFTLYFLGAKESHFVYRPVKALKTGSRKCLYLIFYGAYSIRVPFRKNGPSIFRLESQLTERLVGANPITLSPYNMGAT